MLQVLRAEAELRMSQSIQQSRAYALGFGSHSLRSAADEPVLLPPSKSQRVGATPRHHCGGLSARDSGGGGGGRGGAAGSGAEAARNLSPAESDEPLPRVDAAAEAASPVLVLRIRRAHLVEVTSRP